MLSRHREDGGQTHSKPASRACPSPQSHWHGVSSYNSDLGRSELSINTHEASDPTGPVDRWAVDGLTEGQRRRIKKVILDANVTSWSPSRLRALSDNGEVPAVKKAFAGIAQILFDAAILTRELLREDIPELIWACAAIGRWGDLTSTPWSELDEHPPRVFVAEISRWLGRMLEQETQPITVTIQPTEAPGQPARKQRRAPATVNSLHAAHRMEAFIEARGMKQADFARRAKTSERTILSFRRTGKVRKDIFRDIATAMGTTAEILLAEQTGN